jgi:hypothetical protein
LRSTADTAGIPQKYVALHGRARRRLDDAHCVNHHRIGYEMPRTTHYIATRAVEGAAFYTVAFAALTVWAQYWGARKQRSHRR